MTAIEFNYQLSGLEGNLSRFALSLTLNREEAQDLLQETMLKALSNRNQFADSTNLRAWTFTIMKNTFINNYRRQAHQRTVFDRTADLFFLSQNKDTAYDSPDTLYSAKELTSLIDRLEDEFKIPFKMHLAGFKYKEIAHRLALKLGTVKSRIFFARQKLMGALQELNPNSGNYQFES